MRLNHFIFSATLTACSTNPHDMIVTENQHPWMPNDRTDTLNEAAQPGTGISDNIHPFAEGIENPAWGQSGIVLYEHGTTTPPPFAITSAWEMKDLTWCLETASADLPRRYQLRAIKRATHSWQRRSGITLSRINSCESADILMSFLSPDDAEYDFTDITTIDGESLAHSGTPRSAHQVTIMFNDALVWTSRFTEDTMGPVDIETVALHELGHALGLEHSEDEAAVMFPYYGGSRRRIMPDDIAGMRSLYDVQEGPCVDGAEVTMLAYDYALEALSKADDLLETYSTHDHTIDAQGSLSTARELLWEAVWETEYSHLISRDHAEVAVALFEEVRIELDLAKRSARLAWFETGDEDARAAKRLTVDAALLVGAGIEHANICASLPSDS